MSESGTIDVFLSHLDADAPHAERLRSALLIAGLTVWCRSHDLRPGDLIDEVEPRRLCEAAVIVILVSHHWPISGGAHPDWYRADEVGRAIERARQTTARVVPVLLDGAERARVPHGLGQVHPIRTSSADLTAAAGGIQRAIVALADDPPPAPGDAGWGPDPGPIHPIRLTAPVGDQTRVITDAEVHHACRPAQPLDGGLKIDLTRPPGAPLAPFQAWADDLAQRVRGFLEHRVAPSGVNRLALFGFAPIPLLMALGRVIGDQHPATLFERHRHTQTWRWDTIAPDDFALTLERPADPAAPPADIALLVSISARVKRWAVEAAVPGSLDIYEIRARTPRVNLIRTPEQLAAFARLWRESLDAASDRSRGQARVHVFAAAPISVAMQMGLALLPKADPPLVVYDFQDHTFRPALTLLPPRP